MGAVTGTTNSDNGLAGSQDRSRIKQGTSSLENRLGILLAIATVAAAIIFAIAAIVSAFSWRDSVFIGALLTRTLMVDGSTATGETAWPGLDAGLMRGDQIASIGGVSLGRASDFHTSLQSYQTILRTLRVGQQIEIEFLRNSDLARTTPEQCAPVTASPDRCDVTYRLTSFPPEDFITYFAVPWGSGLAVLLLGAAVFVMRPNQASARTVTIGLMGLSIFLTGLFSLNTTFTFSWVWIVVAALLGGVLISLAFVFPTRSSIAYRQPALRFLPVILAGIAGAVLAYFNINPTALEMPVITQMTAAGIALLGLLLLVVALIVRRRRAISALARDQINTVFIGVALCFAIAVIWMLNVLARGLAGSAPIPLNMAAASPFFVIPALSFAYAVLQYRAYQSDRIISVGITYSIMLGALIIGYFLLVFGASLVTQSVVGANNPVLVAVAIFLVAVLFVPVRTRIQARVDRLYFRKRANYTQMVEDFSRTLSSASELETVNAAYKSALDDGLQPDYTFVFYPDIQTGDYVCAGKPGTDIRFSKDSPLIAALRDGAQPLIYLEPGKPWDAPLLAERARLHILKALVLVGFRGSGGLNGIAVIGAPQSNTGRYAFEELRYIENLTAQMSISVERAQVVASLERRVRELDVLGQVSQAVNFTLEFDDLLELISTQSDKLIEASHFYIVLKDPRTNDIYYAFFLEDEERYREREEMRWPMGRDLYSEVIRTGQSLRIVNFTREMQARGLDAAEDDALRGWMAVPLIAGSDVLGVIAAGTSQPNRQYTDDQLEIFNDIAALAATSIERTRLFRETNVRARQLSVLNDVSRQLVASEVNLEELLRLITASATDILDAEAGSLLLTSDDGSGDLIFRVAIGGSGSDIIGLRVPAGKGLVGEVASTGTPVIVSDVMSDPRWAGELGKGPFQTRSVIAVPLVSQNHVTGVLEVLNKRGVGFDRDDADLLNTFAGQAAVAIENARLFQLTDQQLSMRVSELETLERIDVELNRSLDLTKVARITVEWALENSTATSGLIGVITSEPPVLQVIYSEGYGEGDWPEGAEGDHIPLDRGVVSRVMRSKQPELVYDVSMDRDYIPSLQGALSQVTIPMLSGGSINALLVLETNREPRLRLADMPFLQRLAEHASIAIANARLYNELELANASKSEFVSFVAHELKNPLTSIRGFSDFLLGGQMGGLNDTQRNFIGTIRNNAERMNTLVSDLNDVTKLQTNNMRIAVAPVDFRYVVEETVRPLQNQLDAKNQKLVLEMADDLPPILADEGRMIQVLTNLLSNANKYTPQDGTITLGAALDEKVPKMVIRVADTGIGMSSEDLSKLFTPYFRSENPLAQEQPGTGLGMAITRGIIQQHGGDVLVKSELGKGTTFSFDIPLAAAAEAGD